MNPASRQALRAAFAARVLRPLALPTACAALVFGCSANTPTTSPLPSAAPHAPAASASASPSSATPSVHTIPATQPIFVRVTPALSVKVAPEGTSLIAVSVEANPSAPSTWAVELERREGNAAAATERLTPSRTKSLHSAKSGASYFYRLRVAGGEWTSEVEIHTALPSKPPASPTHLVARASDAFSAALEWEGDVSDAAGFDIEVTSDRGPQRASVVDPDQRAFVHRGRIPGATYGYRVRSFNPAGASAWSPKTEITMPKLGAPAALSAQLAPCTTPPTNVSVSASGIGREELRPAPQELINEPDANDGLLRHLYGRARGCLRALGTVRAQAELRVVEGVDPDPFPMLLVIAGAGPYVGADLVFLRFDGTVYAQVHEVLLCGEPYPLEGPTLTFGHRDDADLRSFQPPFEDCQDDLDLTPP